MAVTASSEPLRLVAYLTGHLDGLGIAEGVTHFSTPARTSVLAGCFAPLQAALRTIWDEGRHWHEGKAAMEPLVPILQDVFRVWLESSGPRSRTESSFSIVSRAAVNQTQIETNGITTIPLSSDGQGCRNGIQAYLPASSITLAP